MSPGEGVVRVVRSYHAVLAFLLAEGTGPADCFRLPRDHEWTFASLGTPAGRRRLSAAVGTAVGDVSWAAFDAQLAAMRRHGVRAMTFFDPGFPRYLRDIPRVPPILFFRGSRACLHRRGVAVVGTRHPTAPARRFAHALAGDLAACHAGVISGAARGIDTAAHEGALAASGTTVAVVGSGLDVPYPPENGPLLEAIADRGCVLGEQIMGTPPLRHTFPQRNRLISALSHAVVVVEAGPRSGALLTARWALEQGREVGAVPGFPGDGRSRGVNALLKAGAFPVEGADDILEAVPILVERDRPPARAEAGRVGEAGAATVQAEAVLEALGTVRADADALAGHLGMPVARLQEALLELEMQGRVARDASGAYYKV